MAFDPSTAKPIEETKPSVSSTGGFDASTAVPVSEPQERRKPTTISGAMRRMREPGFTGPEMPKPLTGEQLKEQFKELGAGGLKGAVAGIPGIPGDIESFGRMLIPGVSNESFFPTSERVGTALFGEPEGETGAEKTGRTIGSLFSPNVLAKGLGMAGRLAIGKTQPEIASLSKKAEGMGFKLEPAQLKKDEPIGSPGFLGAKAKNENLATTLASKETGVVTENITPEFLGKRSKALGDEYTKIFGQKFEIDSDLVKKLQEAKDLEKSVDPAGVGPVSKTADNIIARWTEEATKAQQQTIENRIKRIMQTQGRGGVEPIVRLRRDWPTIRDSSAKDVPDWFSNVEKTVNELSSNLGLQTTPKVWVSAPRREGLYGMATGDGHIIINDSLNAEGAVATALHEFGHQAEFQMFFHAAPETRRSVIQAYNEQMASIPTGKLTVEQHRPLTAAKYPEQGRTSVPDVGHERGYLRNFSEWFAEQTSRWITTTKTPTTTVEKFFAKIADSWKKIYSKVVGHIPLVKEVDNYFRSNWKGDLLDQAVAKEAQEVKAAFIPDSDVIAKIDGVELQRLRSNLTRISRTARDGNDRNAASNLVHAIDDSINKYKPEVGKKLALTNRQYAATMALSDGIEKGFVTQGKISLDGLGNYLSQNVYGYGLGTSKHPLYDLGYMGKSLGIRSRTEGTRLPSYDALTAILGRSKHYLGSTLFARSQAARRMQKGEEAIPQDIKKYVDASRKTGQIAGQGQEEQ